LQGNAEQLLDAGIEANSIDYLVNVESSHCYGNIDNFFTSITTVLKSNGLFLFTDFRGPEGLEELKEKIQDHFVVVNEENISKNVQHALKLDTERRL